MSNKVWTTTVFREDNLRMFGLSFLNKFDYPEFYALGEISNKSEDEKEKREKLLNNLIDINDIYKKFKKLDREIIPTILYGRNIRKDIDFPGFCRTPEGFLLINEKCANILKKFHLGATEIYPVSFFDLVLDEPVNDKKYYFLNIVEWRNYLIYDLSTKSLKESINLNENYKEYKLYYGKYKDKVIAVSKDALNCDLDLWHDPALRSSIFMSDELKNELNDAGLGIDWLLYECKIVD